MAKTDNDVRKTAAVYAAPALEKGLDIIELLAEAPGGLTASELGIRLGRSMSEFFRIIVVMERRGWLRKDVDSDRYRATYKLLELAHRATPAEELTHVASPILYELAQQTGQSCHLVIQNGDRGLVVLRQENPGPTGFSVRLGAAIDLLASCSGHVLLAFSNEERRAVKIPAELGKRLLHIRRQGFEELASARTDGVIDISVPVFGYGSQVIAAVTVPFLGVIDGSQQMGLDDVRGAVLATARAISIGLGWVDGEDRPVPATLSAPPEPRARRRSTRNTATETRAVADQAG